MLLKQLFQTDRPDSAGKAKAGVLYAIHGQTGGSAGKNCEIPRQRVPYLSASAVRFLHAISGVSTKLINAGPG